MYHMDWAFGVIGSGELDAALRDDSGNAVDRSALIARKDAMFTDFDQVNQLACFYAVWFSSSAGPPQVSTAEIR